MNSNRLPPLQWLPAFEAAARHLSFKRAAEELFVTPSAISQQIKVLEERIGSPLFHRRARAIELTETGAYYFPIVADLLAQHRRGFSLLARKFGDATLRINTIPFVANELLIPNLSAFKNLHPAIDLRLETSMTLVDFEHEPVDIALRFGFGHWPGLEARSLGRIFVAPIASPSLLAQKPLREIADLNHHRLIHIRENKNDWQRIFEYIGEEMPQPEDELVFDSLLAAVTAADRGLGVALGLFPLIAQWVVDGRLVAPLPTMWPIPQRYYICYREEDAQSKSISAVCDWVAELFAGLPDVR